MRKMLSVLLAAVMLMTALPVSALAADYETVVTKTQDAYENLSIGGGGAMVTPLIDPTDSNRFYATCDMGGLYYSYDRGATWSRTKIRATMIWLRSFYSIVRLKKKQKKLLNNIT